LFGDQLPLATEYAGWLTGEGVRRGLIGPREAERIWPRHLINCAVVAALIAPDVRVVDLGSGAGLPGIALAIVRPDLRIVLVESLQRRATFLAEVVKHLGLSAVTVRRARAEELAGARLSADVVTARAVAPAARLCRWAAPLLSSSGCLLAVKGDGVMDELATGWRSIRSAGFSGGVELLSLGVSGDPLGGRATWRNVWSESLGRWSAGDARSPEPTHSARLSAGDDRAALVLRLCRRSPRCADDDSRTGGVV
jgi:16S rRNA (guanine527-N7)-methyltransferase